MSQGTTITRLTTSGLINHWIDKLVRKLSRENLVPQSSAKIYWARGKVNPVFALKFKEFSKCSVVVLISFAADESGRAVH